MAHPRARRPGRVWRIGRRLGRLRPPRGARALVYGALGLAVLFVVNGCYQVLRKPTELLGLVAPSSPKSPQAIWEEYGPLVRKHSTEIMRPALLAALIQVESQGDPLARTYWRWRWSWNPLEIYRPASSAVGILQITDGAFAEARRLCIRNNAVARQGAWHDFGACWFNALYLRPVPSHSIEMTSAWLHQIVVDLLREERISRATLDQKQRLAAVVHLCGRERGRAVARRGFRLIRGERCGDHDLASYLGRVRRLTSAFARLDAAA